MPFQIPLSSILDVLPRVPISDHPHIPPGNTHHTAAEPILDAPRPATADTAAATPLRGPITAIVEASSIRISHGTTTVVDASTGAAY